MEPISRQDVEKIMQWGKSLSEEQCTRLLDHFENYQSQLYNAIYGELSDAIAAVNLDMANLFLDLRFDIFLIYNWVEGDIPREPEDKQWLTSKIALLDAELKSLSPESAMDTKLSVALNERFVARCKESGTPLGLLSCLNDEVHRYASFNPARVPAISLTNNLLFAVVRMMDSVYEYQPESLASLPEKSISTLSYTNRAGKTYFLYQGVTRTGKPRFYFSSKEKTEAESVHSIPDGYEIYERPESGQVFLRKAMLRLISEDESSA